MGWFKIWSSVKMISCAHSRVSTAQAESGMAAKRPQTALRGGGGPRLELAGREARQPG
jgi:hypothetical protein